jgi:Domain of unknown function (DUF4347)/Bacterial Ig-like domain/FG-GAP-like repeat/RTX calcium-binding nonapeptide repeat (4 copies)
MNTLTQLNKKNPFVASTNNQLSSIVILDPTVPESDRLADGIKPDTAIYILENKPDAIEQITSILAQHQGIETLHIITHGSPGKIYLRTTELNSRNIENYSQQLQQWRNALSANASIILYGCNVAVGKSGHQFLTQLNQFTGANIAANSQPTGNCELGGTWDILQLIPRSGQKAKLALTETTLKTYSGVLGFAPKVDFPTGSSPFSVSIGDINGDGKPDLATANSSSNLSILLNTTATGAATPTFAPSVTVVTYQNSISLSIGDINGDGKPDLATANSTNNTASIVLNTTPTGATTPTFAPPVTFPTGNRPRGISIGDFNSDGKPDLAVANLFGSNVSILVNTTATGATTPTFAPKVDFATGTNPYSVSIGDINGDGKPDLATANRNSSNVSILVNTTTTGGTTPTFAPKVDFATGTNPVSVSIGDINSDGKPDLATANRNSSNVSILVNTTPIGSATPTFAPQVIFATGTNPYSVSIGDINGDSKPDLAVANYGSSNVSIVLNTTATGATTPIFATQVTFATGGIPRSVNIGDINNDGKPDLAVGDSSANKNVSILLNNTAKVTAVTATTPDGSYGVGATIAITVTFDSPVTVTGTPRLQLETGTTDQFATYTSGSGTTALTFNYVVQAGDTSADLEYLSTNALTLNGGTIKDNLTVDVDADLTLPALASANSLGGSKAIVIGQTIADNIPPTVALTSTSPATVNSKFTVTATFSENVTGFDNTDLNVANATVSNFVTVDARTYTFDVIPSATGNVTVDVLAAKATDNAGNNNTAATQLIRTANIVAPDVTPPNVTLTSSSTPTVTGLFNVTATFNEDVTGFDNTDITVTNAIVSNFIKVDAKTYTFNVTPAANGNVTVDVPAAKATDTAGNNNTAATQLTRTANITSIPQPTDQNWPVPPTPPVNNQLPIVNNPIWDQSRATGFSSNTAFVFAPDTFIAPNPGNTITYTVTALDNNSVAEGEDYFWTQGANGGSYKRKTENASVTTIPTIFDGQNAALKFDPTTRTLSQVAGNNLSLPQWVEVKATSSNGKSVSELLHLQGWSCTGFVIDDYIAGANVFFDANKNGIADPNEPKGTTDGKGAYAFDIPFSTFDTNNNGKLDPNEGNLAAVGGTDIGTGLPLETPLKATGDATVITLLTSMVAELADRGLSVNEANAKVTSAFGIPSDIALNYVDPIAATFGGQPGAKAALTAMLVAQNSITQTAGLIEGASNLTMNDAVKQIISTIADRILTGTFDFTKPEQVADLIGKVADRVKAIDPNFNAQEISVAAPALAQVIAASNQRIVSAIVLNTDPTQLQTQVAVVQKIALGATTEDFKAFGAGQKSLDSLVAENTGAALDEQILTGGNTPVTPTPTPITPTPTPITPTPTPITPTPTPITPTPTPITPTPTPITPTPTPITPTPTPNPTNTATPTPTNTPTPTPSSIALPTLLPTGEVQITIATPQPSVSSNIASGLPENTRLGDVYLLTDGNDTSFPAAALGLSVFALSGNDSLTGLDFPNTYFGNQGEDTLVGAGGNDELLGGKGSDAIDGGIGNDFVSGNNGNDILLGGDGDDTLRGGKDDDILSGGAGNDVLNGDPGFDLLTGGAGNDIFVLQEKVTELSQADVILDFTVADKIQLIDVTFSQLTFESISVVLDGATAVTSTAIKSGNNYLGVVYNVNSTALNSSSFL